MQIETSGDLAGNLNNYFLLSTYESFECNRVLFLDTYEPSTSKTKIKIVSNGHNSPQHSRDYGTDDSSSSTEPYKLPSVRSEVK